MILGGDPEFLVMDGKGQPLPGHLFFPSKEEKHIVGLKEVEELWTNGGNAWAVYKGVGWSRERWEQTRDATFQAARNNTKIFRDGYSLEVNPCPSPCRGELFQTFHQGLKEAFSLLPGKDLTLSAVPSAKIDLGALEGAPEDLLRFGCDPAWNAYAPGDPEFGVEIDATSHPYRYTGGHMHFSTPSSGGWECEKVLTAPDLYPSLIKMFDLYITIPLLFLSGEHKGEWARRCFYGKAGEYRPQVYADGARMGVEYRVPSPILWLNNHLFYFAFGVARWIIRNFKPLLEGWDPSLEEKVQKAINYGGVEPLLPTLKGWYDPDYLRKVKEVQPKIRTSVTSPTTSAGTGSIWGWHSLLLEKKLQCPVEDVRYPPNTLDVWGAAKPGE